MADAQRAFAERKCSGSENLDGDRVPIGSLPAEKPIFGAGASGFVADIEPGGPTPILLVSRAPIRA